MAVAVDESSIGTAEGQTLVRGDFVLSPNAPTTVTPGDAFEVSVGVANNVEGSGPDAKVAVTLAASPHLEVVGPASVTLPLGAMREGSARFRLRTRDVLGSATLTFAAALLGDQGGDQAREHRTQVAATTSVRPATAYTSRLLAGSFRGEATVPLERDLYPQHRTLQASVSPLPLALAHGLVAYLERYPYTCTEQLVSQAVPALVLARRPELGYLRSGGGATLATLVADLRARQNADGSFRYWAGGVASVDLVSAWAQHALLLAAEGGQAVPGDLMSTGNLYLRELARRDPDTLAEERTTAYAISLLARQGELVTNEAAALQKRLVERYAESWPQDVAAAYLAAAQRLMKQDALAERTIARVAFDPGVWDRWHDPMSWNAELLYLLARHFPERLRKLPEGLLDGFVRDLQGGRFQSLSAARTVLALDAYATASGADARAELSVEATLGDGKRQALPLPAGTFPRVELPPSTRSLRLASASPRASFYLVNESGFDRTPPAGALREGLEITREYLDAAGRPVTRVALGDEVTVHLRFRALGRPSVDDAVLVDLLPGGFDLVLPRGGCDFLFGRPAGFPELADRREDRVVLYGAVGERAEEVSYRIKATNVGEYAVPAAYGESMYDPTVRARAAAGRIAVVAAGHAK
jgi:hypothetical protein